MSRFQFIEDHREDFPLKRLCGVQEVNRSSFYKWRASAGAREERERADAALGDRIRSVHAEFDGAYGAPRITAELREADDAPVNEKKVARVMRKFAIVGTHLRKKIRTTVPEPSATPVPDLFRRDFSAPAPNMKYMGDITYLPVGDGEFLYLATVLDCFSKRVVGWSIASHMRTELVADALEMAMATRGSLDGAIFHTDHGAQRRQRRLRELPRVTEAGDPQGRPPLGRGHQLPPTGLPLADQVQRPAPPLGQRPTLPRRPGAGVRAAVR